MVERLKASEGSESEKEGSPFDLGAPPDFDAIRQARERIDPYIHRTPVMTCSTINKIVAAEVFFKCENLQKIGAFKARGAHNAVFSLTKESLRAGLVTHSSGNHAAAVALAAKNAGSTAHVVMPRNSARVKIAAVERLGGKITFCEPTTTAREEATSAIQKQTGATLVHPYDDWRVIAGQGTAAFELLEQASKLDALMAPVGGGGLLAGTAIVGKHAGLKTWGAEPLGADDAFRSLEAGYRIPLVEARTIADGLRTSVGLRPFQIISTQVDGIVTVSEEAIVRAMRSIWEMMKIIVEPSCAVPLAALMEHRDRVPGTRIGVILTGGNVDLDALPWMVQHS